MTFLGRIEFNLFRTRKKFSVNWSGDGKTMTVNSIVNMIINGKTEEFKVIEVWRLINDGTSIALEANLKSTLIGERAMKHVYDKGNYYFSRFGFSYFKLLDFNSNFF